MRFCNICCHLVLGFDTALLAVGYSEGSDSAPGVASQWVSFKDLGQDPGREGKKNKWRILNKWPGFQECWKVSCSINLNGNWKLLENQAINFCFGSSFDLHRQWVLTTEMVFFFFFFSQHFIYLLFLPMWISGPEINPTGVQGAGTQKNNMEITWTVSSSLTVHRNPILSLWSLMLK